MLIKKTIHEREPNGRIKRNTLGLSKYPALSLEEGFRKEIDEYFGNRVKNFCLETNKISIIIAYDKLINP